MCQGEDVQVGSRHLRVVVEAEADLLQVVLLPRHAPDIDQVVLSDLPVYNRAKGPFEGALICLCRKTHDSATDISGYRVDDFLGKPFYSDIEVAIQITHQLHRVFPPSSPAPLSARCRRLT